MDDGIKPVPLAAPEQKKLGWTCDLSFLDLVSRRTASDFHADEETVQSVISVLTELGHIKGEGLDVPLRKTIEQLAPWAERWAYDREIFKKGTPKAQAEKTIEEAEELAFAIANKDPDGIKEEMGDTLVTLIIQAKMQDLVLSDCLEHSLKKINSRIGRMENETFVKNTEAS